MKIITLKFYSTAASTECETKARRINNSQLWAVRTYCYSNNAATNYRW